MLIRTIPPPALSSIQLTFKTQIAVHILHANNQVLKCVWLWGRGWFVCTRGCGWVTVCVRMYAWACISFALATEYTFFVIQLIRFQCLSHKKASIKTVLLHFSGIARSELYAVNMHVLSIIWALFWLQTLSAAQCAVVLSVCAGNERALPQWEHWVAINTAARPACLIGG